MSKATKVTTLSARPSRAARLLAAAAVATITAVVVGATVASPPTREEGDADADGTMPTTGVAWGDAAVTPIGTPICSTRTSNAADVSTDCEPNDVNVSNETSIAVNPQDPNNLIGGGNHWHITPTRNGALGQIDASPRVHVTFDGGRTWTEYPLIANSSVRAADASVAFDATGHAYYAMLADTSDGSVRNPNVVVARSGDGGRRWSSALVARGGVGSGSNEILDRTYLTAWGDGNALVVWLGERNDPLGAITMRIYGSLTHDAGATWTTPVVLSGSFDLAHVPIPAVAADGRVYVSFLVGDPDARDTYEIVEVSPATGAVVAGPFAAAAVVGAKDDYPIDAVGRRTYQDSQFWAYPYGDLAADPTDPAHLALVWSDMRDGALPSSRDPYSAVTNSDVVVSQSFDRGRTWSSPRALELAGDQWMPWGEYDATGRLRIGMYDRSADPAHHAYHYALASEISPGTLSFGTMAISAVASDPTRDARWFATTVDPSFPDATLFLGDYSSIAVIPGTTTVVAYWTDLRELACFGGTCGQSENAYFARVP